MIFEHGILFSGGLDSMAAAILNPDAVLIRIGTGTRYEDVEAAHANKVAEALGRQLVTDDALLDFAHIEQPDALVPGRNAFLVLAAARIAVCVDLVSVEGDGTHATDKDEEFVQLMERLCSKMYGNRRIRVPYRGHSKPQLASAARRKDATTFNRALAHVWSCYTPTNGGLHCGQCKACVRLWAATAGIGAGDEAPRFAFSPAMLPYPEFDNVFEGRGQEAYVARLAYRGYVESDV